MIFLCNHLHFLVKRPFLSNSEKLITGPGEHVKAENNLYIGFGWFCVVCWFSVPPLVEHICFVIRGTCHMKEKESCIILLYESWNTSGRTIQNINDIKSWWWLSVWFRVVCFCIWICYMVKRCFPIFKQVLKIPVCKISGSCYWNKLLLKKS